VPEPFMYDEKYYILEGPFSKEFRDGDSWWAFLTSEEL